MTNEGSKDHPDNPTSNEAEVPAPPPNTDIRVPTPPRSSEAPLYPIGMGAAIDEAGLIVATPMCDGSYFNVLFSDDIGLLKEYLYIQVGKDIQVGKEYPLALLSGYTKSDRIRLTEQRQHATLFIKDGDGRKHTLMKFDIPAMEKRSAGEEAQVEQNVSLSRVSDHNPVSIYALKSLAHHRHLPQTFSHVAHECKNDPQKQLTTDLHSHFAAVPTADQLLNIAHANNKKPFYYPISILKGMNINTEQYRAAKNVYPCGTTKLTEFNAILNDTAVKALKQTGFNNSKKGIVFEDDLKKTDAARQKLNAAITQLDAAKSRLNAHFEKASTSPRRRNAILMHQDSQKRRDLEDEVQRLTLEARSAEIAFQKTNQEFLDINQLNQEDLQKFKNWLSIPATKQITFDEMEKYYDNRAPLIKNIEFFEDYLWAAAESYHKKGVKAVSLSFSDRICSPEWLAIADRVLPEIEKKYGLKMRFLVAIVRLQSREQQEQSIDKFKAVADHPAIEGVDVLASEINSTYSFYEPLYYLGKWCIDNNLKHKVIRVHAGETAYHPENVNAAVLLSNVLDMRVRVGHGIFGSTDDPNFIRYFKDQKMEDRVIIEANPDSNYALNHLDNTQNSAIRMLAETHIPVVFGSDGTGLYYTDANQLREHIDYIKFTKKVIPTDFIEALDKLAPLKNIDPLFMEKLKNINNRIESENISAYTALRELLDQYPGAKLLVKQLHSDHELNEMLKDTTAEDLMHLLKSTENLYIRDNNRAYEIDQSNYEKALTPIIKRLKAENSGIPDPEIRQKAIKEHIATRRTAFEHKVSSSAEEQKLAKAKAQREQTLKENLTSLGVTLLPTDPEKNNTISYPMGKKPIMINGGLISGSPLSDFASVQAFMEALVTSSDPSKVCFVTTGNDHGIQKMFHEVLARINNTRRVNGQKPLYDLIGLLAKQAKSSDITNQLSHAALGYDKWYDMHGFIAQQIENNPDFQLISVGGNMLSRHNIQTAYNVLIDKTDRPNEQLHLVKSIPGAAQDKAIALEAGHQKQIFAADSFQILLARLGEIGVIDNNNRQAEAEFERRKMHLEKIGATHEHIHEALLELNGDIGAVDKEDLAFYFFTVLKPLCNIFPDIKLSLDDVIDYFKKDFPNRHPVVTILKALPDAQYTELCQHFDTLGVPRSTIQKIFQTRLAAIYTPERLTPERMGTPRRSTPIGNMPEVTATTSTTPIHSDPTRENRVTTPPKKI